MCGTTPKPPPHQHKASSSLLSFILISCCYWWWRCFSGDQYHHRLSVWSIPLFSTEASPSWERIECADQREIEKAIHFLLFSLSFSHWLCNCVRGERKAVETIKWLWSFWFGWVKECKLLLFSRIVLVPLQIGKSFFLLLTKRMCFGTNGRAQV